jgi:DNA-binding XRE family transcriptional regulator
LSLMPKTNESASGVKVPKGTADPIGYLNDQGIHFIDLAKAWGFRTIDAVYKLRRFEYAPKLKTAQRMAESFGWTVGQVYEHWNERVKP